MTSATRATRARLAARLVPVVVTLLGVVWLARATIPPRDGETGFAVQAFAELPVVYQGRVKPYDTLARNSLVIISDRQTWRDGDDVKRPAIEWLLDVMSNAPRAYDHRVFRIHNHQLLTQLGLERRPGYRYGFREFAPQLPELERQAAAASRLPAEQRDVYDGQVLEFWHRLTLHRVLSETYLIPDESERGLTEAMRRLEWLQQLSIPHAIPPPAGGAIDDEWTPFLRSMLTASMTGRADPALRALAGVLHGWATGDAAMFNGNVSAFADAATASAGADRPLQFEMRFNQAAPFYRCAVLYLIAFLLGVFAWLGWTDTLRRTAFCLLAATFVAHTAAIAARVYISGYPPITNLYGTAVFIGWGCVLLGLFLEWIYRLGAGNLLSATVGFLTLLIAHFLAGDGDTLEMMQAVLDTKFWLATHVIIINLGYSATFLGGGLAGLYVLRGVATKSLDTTTDRAMGRMMYGVLCFALLLSFLGTVLGGLWADDSWGRFWGWDPKENGALMIVLWNALILHARWGGLVKTRGIAVLAMFGNIVTAWSWFGVNQLGVGLHSYGFTESVAFWLLVFVGSQLALMGVGLIPRRLWRSPGTAKRPVVTMPPTPESET